MTETITSDADNVQMLVDAWTAMVECFPGHAITTGGGVTSMLANIPFGFFNMIALDRPSTSSEDFHDQVAIATDRARACNHHKLLAVCAEWIPDDAAKILQSANLKPSMTITGMAADRLLPPRRPLPALDYTRVDDLDSAATIALVNARAYGMPEADVACISNMAIWTPTNIGLIAHHNGRAVATTSAALIADSIYVALVATEPDCHRNGYAETVMRRAIDAAVTAFGPRRIWLHATEMGRPVYAAMGFETGAVLPLYEFGD